jgi:hypothetical protein
VRLPGVPGRMGAGWRRGDESAVECVIRHLERLGIEPLTIDWDAIFEETTHAS